MSFAYEVVMPKGANGGYVRDARTGEIVTSSLNPGALEWLQAWAANCEEMDADRPCNRSVITCSADVPLKAATTDR